jgi:tetratricopeptide (TPR) repeat protein
MAEIAEAMNAIPHALKSLQIAMGRLDEVVGQAEEKPGDLANQVKTMLETVGNIHKFDPGISTQALLDGWLLGRGLDLIGKIGAKQAQLLMAGQMLGQAKETAESLEDILRRFHEVTNFALERDELANVAMNLGEAWTSVDDERSFRYFETVVELLGIEQGITAAANAANALFRLGNYAEAEYRYGTLESLFEHFGMRLAAARMWVYEKMANWKQRHDPDIRHSLVGALKFYEENIPESADAMTLYSMKKYIEDGYLLLASVLVALQDDSPERRDELLRVLRAVYTRDQRADLEPELPEPGWENVLEKQKSPLAQMQNALQPFPQRAVLHLLSGISCLLWIAYGYDGRGIFQFKSCLGDESHGQALIEFLEAMREQQELDLVDDVTGADKVDARLKELGGRIGAALSQPFVDFLLGMKQVHFMPHPFGNLDEFPLAGVRLAGEWLSEHLEIVRTPSFSHLREMLSANRTATLGRPNGAILLGDPETDGATLQKARGHAAWVENAWNQVYGLQAELFDSVDHGRVHNWLEGEVGMIHYVGHGFANVMSEGLFLGKGLTFTLSDIDRIIGTHAPFVFLCACEAGRVRHGRGGYQAGIASKLVERSAPAALGFLMPIPENRAYAIAECFYRQAIAAPLGQAVQQTRDIISADLPSYAWLAWEAYGDPALRLWEMAREGRVTDTPFLAVSWHSALRNYAVLRTPEAEQTARQRLGECPAGLRNMTEKLVDMAYKESHLFSRAALDEMESELLTLADSEPVGALTLRGLIILERAHQAGLDSLPIYIAREPDDVRRLFHELMFVLLTGSVFFDMRFHGFGHAMLGRLLTIDQNETRSSRIYLEQGFEKLRECDPLSPFVRRILGENKELLLMFPIQRRA